MSDDITFCGSDCNNKKCFRHPSNIREPRIPHSFAYLKGTEDCPMKKQEMRLIDANALKERIQLAPDKNNETWEELYDSIIYEIDNAPTVETHDTVNMYCDKDAQIIIEQIRPKGEWIVTAEDNEGIHRIQCPFCGYEKGSDFIDYIIVTFEKFPPFCESCGAELRGKEE